MKNQINTEEGSGLLIRTMTRREKVDAAAEARDALRRMKELERRCLPDLERMVVDSRTVVYATPDRMTRLKKHYAKKRTGTKQRDF